VVDGVFDLEHADAVLTGESDGAEAGHSLSADGDVNGDGVDDLLIGAPHESEYGLGGVAYLLHGPVTGEGGLASADVTLVGEELGSEAGSAVAIVGDTDGDGRDDLLIGDPLATTTLSEEMAGVAYLVRAPSGGTVSLADADARLEGELRNDYAGYAVADAGDVDGDGVTDLLVGAPGSFLAAIDEGGAAYLVPGSVTGTIRLADEAIVLDGWWEHTGFSVAGAGDADGDGFDDILVGSVGVRGHLDEPDEGCHAFLVHGPVGESLVLDGTTSTTFQLDEFTPGNATACSVARAGALQQGGAPAVLIGSEDGWHDDHPFGVVYAVAGASAGEHALGDADVMLVTHDPDAVEGYSDTRLGMAFVSGDVDGDGATDVLAAGSGEDNSAYLWFAPGTGTSDTRDAVRLLGPELGFWEWGHRGGRQAVAMGDLDGDGHRDVVFSETFSDPDDGTIYVVSGARLFEGASAEP